MRIWIQLLKKLCRMLKLTKNGDIYSANFFCEITLFYASVADPVHLDPDPTFHFDRGPDPTFHFAIDQDPTI